MTSLLLRVGILLVCLATASSQKAGLAWPNGNVYDIGQYTKTGKVTWYYNWSPTPIRANIEFAPMLWGRDQANLFETTINRTIPRNDVTAVLGFNEPQHPGQAEMSPEEGADLWRRFIEPLKEQDIRLGTPAPSSAPSGKVWLQDWLNACDDGCDPDFVAVHWYGTNAADFRFYLEDFHNTFQLPLWVTEWACHDFNGGPQLDFEGVVAFLNETQSFMDETDWVERYSWFGTMVNPPDVNINNAMMDSRGSITDLGRQYIGEGSAAGGSPPTPGISATIHQHQPQLLLVFVAVTSTMLFPALLPRQGYEFSDPSRKPLR